MHVMIMIYTSIIVNIITKRFSGSYGFVIEIGCFINEIIEGDIDRLWRDGLLGLIGKVDKRL